MQLGPNRINQTPLLGAKTLSITTLNTVMLIVANKALC
jgi:hypothetical protein